MTGYVDTSTQPSDWWDRLKQVGPGLFDIGAGIYNRSNAEQDAQRRLAQARGPLYDASMAGANATLAQAGSFNPQDFAANRFAANRALVAPVQSKNLDDLMRRMYATGQGGISTYNPGVPGITPNGTPMNPQLAAFYAAQNADNSLTAYNSLTEGQNYLDALLKRSGMLQGTANATQNTGFKGTNAIPSRPLATSEMLKSVKDILTQTGLLGKAVDWFNGGFTKNIGDVNTLNQMDWGGDTNDLGWWG